MSLIAAFFLVPIAHCDGLVDAANAQTQALTTKRWGIVRPKLPLNPDPLWEYLRINARELEEFPYKGSLLLDVEVMSPDILLSDDALGQRLSEVTQSTFISYQAGQARKVIDLLDRVDFSDEAIRRHLQGEGREADIPAYVEPIRDSANRIKDWLGVVSNDTVGLLNVG